MIYTVRMRRWRKIVRHEKRTIEIVIDESRIAAFRDKNKMRPDEPIDRDLLVEMAEEIDNDDLTAEWDEYLTETKDLDYDEVEITPDIE